MFAGSPDGEPQSEGSGGFGTRARDEITIVVIPAEAPAHDRRGACPIVSARVYPSAADNQGETATLIAQMMRVRRRMRVGGSVRNSRE
jgi:hypothetical protein